MALGTCFNPRTPCGVRRDKIKGTGSAKMFQSTHSLRSATLATSLFGAYLKMFQSTHSLRSATKFRQDGRAGKSGFNPRTPCGVRLSPLTGKDHDNFVSIHALLAECDGFVSGDAPLSWGFNPRTPCGVRQDTVIFASENVLFQSTHSLRSATNPRLSGDDVVLVSIHALLAECDPTGPATRWTGTCFNPRTPCGVRPDWRKRKRTSNGFQSTHSLRSATL